MKKTSLLKLFWVVVASIAFGWAPESAFAQRGGHGGGGGMRGGAGGFHGGGGHYAYGGGRYGGYRGGGSYRYRGGGYYGRRGGYYGRRGGYWGYSGYGWGFGIGFDWGSYWPGYAYPYGYSSWWDPYYYPYYAPCGYPYPYNGDDDAPPPDPGPKSRDDTPVKPSITPAPGSFPRRTPRQLMSPPLRQGPRFAQPTELLSRRAPIGSLPPHNQFRHPAKKCRTRFERCARCRRMHSSGELTRATTVISRLRSARL